MRSSFPPLLCLGLTSVLASVPGTAEMELSPLFEAGFCAVEHPLAKHHQGQSHVNVYYSPNMPQNLVENGVAFLNDQSCQQPGEGALPSLSAEQSEGRPDGQTLQSSIWIQFVEGFSEAGAWAEWDEEKNEINVYEYLAEGIGPV